MQMEGTNREQRKKLNCDTVVMEDLSKKGVGPVGTVLQSGLSGEESCGPL